LEKNEFCEYLDWDSEFFERRIACVTLNRLSHKAMQSVLVWCKAHIIDCLYFLVDCGDGETIAIAERNNFHLVDIRHTLSRQLCNYRDRPDMAFEGIIRSATPKDIEPLRALARESHGDSRFYSDLHFPRQSCDSLYETWIEKSCKGYADVVLVAQLEERIVGYISCHIVADGEGKIGLLGVHSEARRKGIGQKLIGASLEWFAGKGLSKLSVVTQGQNRSAQRAYQRCGFLTEAIQLWYHKWFLLDHPDRIG
jgi:ribosomal protein S18 acetylase RimI-like enzyme